MQRISKLLSHLGPGLLYAGAAIGVSHLVQSTRAGANYGFELIWVIFLVNLLKLPFFEVGPQFASKYKKSLLAGYHEISPWLSFIFLLITVSTMFIVQAAIIIVTAGLASKVLGVDINIQFVSISILLFATFILLKSKYSFLDKLIKYVLVFLTLTTVFSVIFAVFFGGNSISFNFGNQFSFENKTHLMFLIAFMGWMPAPLDLSVWHSLWTLEKKGQSEKESSKDFYIGFISTIIMAICFLSLGAMVMNHKGVVFDSGAIGFSHQLIQIYTSILGSWSFVFIAIACLTTMLSTTLTCLDAFPRVLENYMEIKKQKIIHTKKIYNIFLLITLIGTSIVLIFFVKSMKTFVDFATTISFLTTPLLGVLNYIIFRKYFDQKGIKNKLRNILYITGILFFSLFSLYYIYIKFFE
jgi:Mn2+/Fe2+ NRAMP family transporter